MSANRPGISVTPAEAVKAEAALRARSAELFGPLHGLGDTLFPNARVTSEALRQGVAGMITRTLRCVPHLVPAKRNGDVCRVVFSGADAYAAHQWAAQGGGMIVVSGILNLPAITETQTVSRRVADSQAAYALHEAGHFALTNPTDYKSAVENLASTLRIPQSLAGIYCNVVEDVVIEKTMLDALYAAGFGPLIARLTTDTVAETFDAAMLDALREGGDGALRAFPFVVAFGLRGYAQGAEAAVAALSPDLRGLYDETARRIAALPNRLRGFDALWGGTREAMGVAAWLAEALLVRATGHGDPQADKAATEAQREAAQAANDAAQADSVTASEAAGEAESKAEAARSESQRKSMQEMAARREATRAQLDPNATEADRAATYEALQAATEAWQEAREASADANDAQWDAQEVAEAAGHAYQSASRELQAVLSGQRPTSGAGATLQDSQDVTPLPLAEKRTAADSDPLSGVMDAATAGRITRANAAVDKRPALEKGAARILRACPRLAGDLRVMLDASAAESREGGQRSGKLRSGELARAATGADNVFERRTYLDGVDSAVTLLVDQSSSMGNGSIDKARDVCCALAKLLGGMPGVWLEILGFTTTTSSGADLFGAMARDAIEIGGRIDACHLRVFKAFRDPMAKAYNSLGGMGSSGGTPDASALAVAGKRLLAQRAARRVLVNITDGGAADNAVTRAVLLRLKAQGVIVIGIGIDTPVLRAYEYRATITDIAALPKAGLGELFKAVRDDAAKREAAE